LPVLRQEFSHLIARASKDMEDALMVQMVSNLKRRKPPRSVVQAADLFAGLDQVVVVPTTREDGKKVKVNKTPRKLTLIEAEARLEELRRDREKDEETIERLSIIIEKAKPYILEGGTLEEGVAAADAEEAKRKGASS
jgi:hypothetical protein